MIESGPTGTPLGGLGPDATLPPDDQLLSRLRAATLGQYEVLGELGRGGMATVFLAHEISLARKVAIKVMAPALFYGAGMVERFKREARTAAQLSHPNIIPIYAVREAEGLLFFVMKLVDGTPLDSIMREVGRLPIPMVEAILAQVGGAFGYAHRHGVIHRDIKPSNILIDEEGWAVVTDFGIAKVAESESLTLSGVAVGTPTYMSPEQCNGTELTGASDQYSLGVVAYEMLAGRPPFSGLSLMSLMYSHFNDPPPPLEALRAECPEPLRRAVMRMLAKNPAARWPSMEEMVAGIGARQLAHDDPTRTALITLARTGVAHKIISQVQTPRSPVPMTRQVAAVAVPGVTGSTRTRRLTWVLGAGALAALGAAAMLWFTPKQPELVQIPANPPSAAPAPAPAPTPPPAPGGRSTVPPSSPPGAPSASTRTPAGPEATKPALGAERTVRQVEADSSSPVPAPAPPPASTAPVQQTQPVTDTPATPAPPPRAVDDRADVSAAVLTYARALEAGDLAAARRIYPDMPTDQRQGLEAFWRAGGSMVTRWSVSEISVEGDIATARVQGTNTVTTARARATEERVNLRARLQRSGTEWRLLALVN